MNDRNFSKLTALPIVAACFIRFASILLSSIVVYAVMFVSGGGQ